MWLNDLYCLFMISQKDYISWGPHNNQVGFEQELKKMIGITKEALNMLMFKYWWPILIENICTLSNYNARIVRSSLLKHGFFKLYDPLPNERKLRCWKPRRLQNHPLIKSSKDSRNNRRERWGTGIQKHIERLKRWKKYKLVRSDGWVYGFLRNSWI